MLVCDVAGLVEEEAKDTAEEDETVDGLVRLEPEDGIREDEEEVTMTDVLEDELPVDRTVEVKVDVTGLLDVELPDDTPDEDEEAFVTVLEVRLEIGFDEEVAGVVAGLLDVAMVDDLIEDELAALDGRVEVLLELGTELAAGELEDLSAEDVAVAELVAFEDKLLLGADGKVTVVVKVEVLRADELETTMTGVEPDAVEGRWIGLDSLETVVLEEMSEVLCDDEDVLPLETEVAGFDEAVLLLLVRRDVD